MSITISGGGGAPGITVETDPTALKLTGGEITANNNQYALRIIQQGLGNVLEVFDESGDTTPFVINGSGNVGIGSAVNPAYKLNIGGGVNVAGTINAFTILANGTDFRSAVFNEMFSGNVITTVTNPITAAIYYYDGNNTFESGGYDDNYTEIPLANIGSTTNSIGWVSASTAFQTISSDSIYSSGSLQFYTNGQGTVTVSWDEYGTLSYDPPSQ